MRTGRAGVEAALGRHVGVCSSEGSGVIRCSTSSTAMEETGDGRSSAAWDVECDHRHAGLAE